MSASWSSLMSPEAYKSPAFIALVTVLCVALVLLLHHCVLVTCCRRRSGSGTGADRRRRRQHHHRHHNHQQQQETEEEDEEVSISVEVSAATSRTHLVKAAQSAEAVVCRYRKEEEWKEPTCAVCLADFDDGEPVRVLPECLHYFHAECIGTWLQGSTSCPMCRAETTPTPTPTTTPSPASLHHHHHRHLELNVSVSVSLEEILVRT